MVNLQFVEDEVIRMRDGKQEGSVQLVRGFCARNGVCRDLNSLGIQSEANLNLSLDHVSSLRHHTFLRCPRRVLVNETAFYYERQRVDLKILRVSSASPNPFCNDQGWMNP